MCRLFGFRSAVNIGVHHSLVLAENALAQQSESNPDGWGIGFYEGSSPILRRGLSKAIGDGDFANLARFVRSQAVVAHVRLGTVGGNGLRNTHPFSLGRWVFAHNGTLRDLSVYHDRLMDKIDRQFHPLIEGETDSERCFYLFMSQLGLRGIEPNDHAPGIVAFDAMAATIAILCALTEAVDAPPPLINFLATDGRSMIANRLGRGLFFSTQKRYCEKMNECSRWRDGEELPCMHPLRAHEVNHVLIASETISTEDIWEPLAEGDLIGIDANFTFVRTRSLPFDVQTLTQRYAPFYKEDGQDALHAQAIGLSRS